MNSLSAIALSGMNAAQLRLDTAAQRIANAQTPVPQGVDVSENLADDLVQTMVAVYSFKANLKSLQTEYSLLGSLLDTKA